MVFIQLLSAVNLTTKSINVLIASEELRIILDLTLSLFVFFFLSIQQAITAALSRFGLDVFMDKITYVSDRGSNLVKVLEDYEVVHCFPHRLNNVLKRTFYSAGTAEKNEKKRNKPIKDSSNDDKTNRFTFILNDDDPLMDYDDRDSSDSEEDSDCTLNAKTVELALRCLSSSSSPERDHINVFEKDLAPAASQVLATIVRCKQLCCYVKRVFIFLL